MSKFLCLFVFLMTNFKSLYSQEIITITETNFCYNSSLKGFRLNVPVLEVRNVSGKSACVDNCFAHPCCRSMNYNYASSVNQSGKCELLHDLVENTSYVLEPNSSFDHLFFNYPLKEYNASCIPKEPKEPENKNITNITNNCSSSPCLNGTCVVDGSAGYLCECHLGYFGPRCETHVCSLFPCENFGTCHVNESTGYQCQCPPGYSGTQCETLVNFCTSSTCQNHGSCRLDSSGEYRCICFPEYTGINCETVFFDVCSTSPCGHGTTCVADGSGGYRCICPLGYSDTHCEQTHISCKGVFDNNSSETDGVYYLQSNESSEIYPVYCHMSNLSAKCGGGGWTLVMKLDGDKKTFEYNSVFWTNKETWNVEAGLDGLTEHEAKLASYHNTPFTKLCLGMTKDSVTNWILVDYQAASLYNVIADGNYHETNVGRAEWMSLVNGASLQQHCNMEGFNVQFSHHNLKLRIGIAGNNEDDCDTCDSVNGFGVRITKWYGKWYGIWRKSYKWSSGSFNFQRFINILKSKTFGYIFVQ